MVERLIQDIRLGIIGIKHFDNAVAVAVNGLTGTDGNDSVKFHNDASFLKSLFFSNGTELRTFFGSDHVVLAIVGVKVHALDFAH